MVDDLVQLDPPGWAKSTIRELFELDPRSCASSTTKLFQLDRFLGSGFGVWRYVHGLIASLHFRARGLGRDLQSFKERTMLGESNIVTATFFLQLGEGLVASPKSL